MSLHEELTKLKAQHAALLARRLAKTYTNDELSLLVDRQKDIKALLKGMVLCDPERRAKAVQPVAAPVVTMPAPVVNPATVAAAMTAGW